MQAQGDAIALLTVLNDVHPLGDKEIKTPKEVFFDGVKKWLLIITAVLFMILCPVVGALEFNVRLSYIVKSAALILACIAVILPVLVMLIEIFFGVIRLVKFKPETFRILLLEINRDKTNIESVIVFERKVLIEVKSWLAVKCSRIQSKIGLIFGGSEKVALVSLAAFGWIAFKEVLNKQISDSFQIISGGQSHFAVALVVALFVGLSVGAVLQKNQLRRYMYYMEIIEMALNRKQGQS